MGTDCHIMVVGPNPDALADSAVAYVERLEQRWSRFLGTSEVTAVNQAGGKPVAVSPETLTLFERASLAHRLTDGRFNPFMGRRIAELGYDRPFQTLNLESEAVPALGSQLGYALGSESASEPNRQQWSIADEAVDFNRSASTVKLANGLAFDPGGIGKGLAADLVSAASLTDGAWGVMVNLGGDLRVRGIPPSGDIWVVQITEPMLTTEPITTVRLAEGGLATSTTVRRRWTAANVTTANETTANESTANDTAASEARGSDMHHLIDPTTGMPADGPVLASVIAGDAWWAEASATAACASQTPLPVNPSCAALVIHGDGTTDRYGGFEDYEVETSILEKQHS